MKTTTRIYRINDHLVEATGQAVAVNHVARGTLNVRVATQRDLIELRDRGVQVQKAGGQWVGPQVMAQLSVQISVPAELPDDVRAAGEEYLRAAGDQATSEGLVSAIWAAVEGKIQVATKALDKVTEVAEDPAPTGELAEVVEAQTTAHYPI